MIELILAASLQCARLREEYADFQHMEDNLVTQLPPTRENTLILLDLIDIQDELQKDIDKHCTIPTEIT